MKRQFSKYITIAVFIVMLGGFFVLNRLVEPPPILESERRQPAAFPEMTAKSFSNASFMSDFDKWAQDSFVSRELFRTLRAISVFKVFHQTDKEGLYIGATGAGKFQKIDETAWRQAIVRINRLVSGLEDGTFADGGLSFYIAVVPDKSVYAGRYLPGYDSEMARRLILEGISPSVKSIDLTDALAAEDFYKTDLHWRQPYTKGVMDSFSKEMGFEGSSQAYATNFAGTFKGAYAGQVALPMAPDALEYVQNSFIENASMTYLDPKTASMQPGRIYYTEALTGRGDPYDFFLNGPQPLIVLEVAEQYKAAKQQEVAGQTEAHDSEVLPRFDNKTMELPRRNDDSTEPLWRDGDTRHVGGLQRENRTLYLFRDSFGSSLAPLFLGSYDRVVLIDLRYIDSRILTQYVDFEPGSDVLFLYSSQILNNPTVLLVN
jgi:hypothetical protein